MSRTNGEQRRRWRTAAAPWPCALGSLVALSGSACSDSGFAGVYLPDAGAQPEARGPDARIAPATAAGPAPSLATAPRRRLLIDETGEHNPAGLSAAEVDALMSATLPMANGASQDLRWLYPYEGTVFPRGTLAPTVMWQGTAADAVYLHVQSLSFEYRGILVPGLGSPVHAPLGLSGFVAAATGAAPQPQLQIPQHIWDKACERTLGKRDSFTIELTVRAQAEIQGPIAVHVQIAQATVKGAIYYNSYQTEVGETGVSALVSGAKVLRIPPMGRAELLTASEQCNGCHSVSANGARLIAQTSSFNTPSFDAQGNLLSAGAQTPNGAGLAYSLTSSGAGAPTPAGARASFGALYPDGSKYLATGLFLDIGGQALYETPATPLGARLFDLERGLTLTDTGIPDGALMPMFSADGTRLVFNDHALETGHGLATMDYDVGTDTATGYQPLIQWPGSEPTRPGFPVFLPDNRAVIFIRTTSPDFTATHALVSSVANQSGASTPGVTTDESVAALPRSDLYIVDVATHTSTLLARAMGYQTPDDADNDVTYLPFGESELHHNYFPTLSPVAAGGYFWVFFDSMRHVGNLGLQRQLWGAALEIDAGGSYTRDPSYPAFYLPGQNLGDSNHRAFAALEPCRADGGACTSGIDCCSGSCDLAASSCIARHASCAQLDESCLTTDDCCPSGPTQAVNLCIAGFCAWVDLL